MAEKGIEDRAGVRELPSGAGALEGEKHKFKRAQWDGIKRAYLLKLLHEHSGPRWRGQNGWTKEAWLKISQVFNLKFPNANLSKVQIKEQEQQIKKIYKVLKKLSELSGFGWDRISNMVTASDDVWQPLLEVDKEARKWHKRSWPHYSICQELYEERFAKEKLSSDPKDCRARPTSQPLSPPHQSSPGEMPPVPNIPVSKETSQPFDVERDLEEFGDTNMDLQYAQALQPPPPHSPIAPRVQSQSPSQMSANISAKRCRSSESVPQDFIYQYIAMKERENDRYIEAMKKARQPPDDKYSIPRCIEVLNKVEGFTIQDLVKATRIFKVKENREIFLSLRDDQRVTWLRAEMDEM